MLLSGSDAGTFHGLLVWSDSWSSASSPSYGLYEFSLDRLTPNKQFAVAENALTAVCVDDYYYVVTRATDNYGYLREINIFKYDITSGEQVDKVPITDLAYSKLPVLVTYDRSTSTTYALTYSEDNNKNVLAKLDLSNGEMTAVGEVSEVSSNRSFLTFSSDGNGHIYTISTDGNLYVIDTATGVSALVGATGVMPRYIQSAYYNTDTSTLWWAASFPDGKGALYTVDVTTGAATLVADLPNNEEYVGLYMDTQAADPMLPKRATDLKLDISGAATSGTLSFKMPSVTNGGTALSGSLTADITVDGVSVKTLTAAPGEDVSTPLTLAEGMRSIGVTVTAPGAGTSTMATLSQWVGTDAPTAVSELVLTSAGNSATLTWKAPTGGQHGGYCDLDGVRYRIVRSDGTVVADAHATTSYTEEFPGVKAAYSYTVIPVADGKEGLPVTSNEVWAGSYYSIPFFYDFNNEVKFNEDITIVDNNHDNYTWAYSMSYSGGIGMARYNLYWGQPADDYLIMPGVKMEGGMTYRFRFDISGIYGSPDDKMKIMVGREGETVADYKTVADFQALTRDYTELQGEFAIEEDGVYRLALYLYTEAAGNMVEIDNLSIVEVAPSNAPRKPEFSLNISQGADADEVTVTVKAPTETTDGQTLDAITAIDVYRNGGETPVHTFDNPAPGSKISWTDTEPGEGTTEYAVRARNNNGTGEAASKTVFVGGQPLPYSYDFNDPVGFRFYKINDVNNDEKTWALENGTAKYTYNMFEDADDWLFTPDIRMNPNRVYEVSVKAHTTSYNQENLAIAVGDADNLESQKVLIDLNNWSATTPTEYSSYFRVDSKDRYNIGLHAYSPKNRLNIFIDEISVKDVADSKAPAEATDMKVTADPAGLTRATIDFTTPTVDNEGKTISSLSSVEVFRGKESEPAKVFSNVTPGQWLTWTDENSISGIVTYRVVASNSYGRGLATTAGCYVGFDAPTPVKNLKAVAVDNNANAEVTWEAPTAGIHGGVLNPSSVTYTVTRFENWSPQVVASGLTECKFTDNCNVTGEQHNVEYRVTALNSLSDPTNEAVVSDTIILGKLYTFPLKQDFSAYPNGEWPSVCLTNYNAGWGTYTDNTPTMDGAPGLLVFSKYSEAEERALAVFSTPKLSLEGATMPYVSLAILHEPADSRKHMRIGYRVNEGEFNELGDVYICEGEEGWRIHSWVIPAELIGSVITVEIQGESYDSGDYSVVKRMYADNLIVDDAFAHNLTVNSFTGSPDIGSDGATLTAEIFNKGLEPVAADDYQVVLMCDDTDVDTKTAGALATQEIGKVTFDIPAPPATDAGNVRLYQVRIDYAEDMKESDNFSDIHEMKVLNSKYPAVPELSAALSGDDVVLNWSDPDKHYSESVLESFENMEAFIIDNFENWLLYDGDGQRTYVFRYGLTFANCFEPKAWQVWVPFMVGLEGRDVLPRTGDRCLMGMASDGTIPGDDERHEPANDDWLISEEVVGGSEVSFWIMEPLTSYGNEGVELLYSTTDQEVGSFKLLESYELTTSVEYMRCAATLPDDARYFAIRHNKAPFGMFLDDITYTPTRNTFDLAMSGVNIYRDNKLLATAPAGLSYTDVMPAEGHYVYAVAPLFDRGEGRLSNAVEIDVVHSGIVNVNASGRVPVVTGHRGYITIAAEGMYPVEIFTPDGRRVVNKAGAGKTIISMAPGIYIVKAGTTVAKVGVE